MNSRRAFVMLAVASLAWPRRLLAGPADDKRLDNRLELWSNYARRTRNLLVRVTTRRETSLLSEPLFTTGTLAFRAPSTLVLRDDGLSGSTTLIEGERVFVVPNQRELPPGPPIDTALRPAAAWFADRLVRMFAPGEGPELIANARVDVPKGRGYRLEILPERGSRVRKLIRSITIHLDPVAGHITEILLTESQGDRLRLQLTDHRQNLPDDDVSAYIDQAHTLVAAHTP